MVRPMTCPICGKAVLPATDLATSTVPFCSERCKQIDFSRWNDGRYVIVENLDPARLAEQLGKQDPDLSADDE
ncbi:MAG: DNA gyrase inhibitor YacG [Planctomycetes bacterium]|nr:DNA gyrase inhibitor YacG [Planctomycetota bacterium]